jgi:hypothetical protein
MVPDMEIIISQPFLGRLHRLSIVWIGNAVVEIFRWLVVAWTAVETRENTTTIVNWSFDAKFQVGKKDRKKIQTYRFPGTYDEYETGWISDRFEYWVVLKE